MRILGILVLMMFLAAGASFAATVDLNDGNVVQGTIIKQDNRSLQINVDGVTMTYYSDEIKDIDGRSFAAAQTPPAAAPVVQAVPVVQPKPIIQPVPVTQPIPVVHTAPVGAAMDPNKRALILKFIDVFGTRQALINNFDLMLKQIEKDKPDEAQKIRQRVKIDEIIERLLPIYDRNFTSEDLNAFIAFYGSAEGQKLIGTIPELMKESVQESVKYMEEKFPEARQGQ